MRPAGCGRWTTAHRSTGCAHRLRPGHRAARGPGHDWKLPACHQEEAQWLMGWRPLWTSGRSTGQDRMEGWSSLSCTEDSPAPISTSLPSCDRGLAQALRGHRRGGKQHPLPRAVSCCTESRRASGLLAFSHRSHLTALPGCPAFSSPVHLSHLPGHLSHLLGLVSDKSPRFLSVPDLWVSPSQAPWYPGPAVPSQLAPRTPKHSVSVARTLSAGP